MVVEVMFEIITMSGLPGSGTTTTCRLLAEKLGWSHVNAGQIFRELAAEEGVSLAEYGYRAERDGRIDRELDARMVATAREGSSVILEGRLTGWMALRHNLSALKVWLAAPVRERARRVSAREREALERTVAEMREREDSEAKRYREFHDIDLADLGFYDLRVDTRTHTAEQAAAAILTRLQEVRA